MVERERAGEILNEMVKMARTFRVAGQWQRERSILGTKIGMLRILTHRDARLTDLAHSMSVSASVASRVIDTLEAHGMVERRADDEDARASMISITDLGRQDLTERERYVADIFAESMADWAPEETDQAIAILAKLNGHLADLTQTLESDDGRVSSV